ncbi:MAG: hypothetical protein NT006_00750 [Candidatus Aminicenantes bacterium]|nr:hypothetical protein [Candidatus Aminicenantes bacterium]
MKKMLILLFFALSTAAVASDSWPGWFKSHPKTGHSQVGTTRGAGINGYSLTEPQAIALLGVGLVSLGVYAKRKQGKKR